MYILYHMVYHMSRCYSLKKDTLFQECPQLPGMSGWSDLKPGNQMYRISPAYDISAIWYHGLRHYHPLKVIANIAKAGFEPATSGVWTRRAPWLLYLASWNRRIRTFGILIRHQLLCHLSYVPIPAAVPGYRLQLKEGIVTKWSVSVCPLASIIL